jgi:hypothetical protein
MAFKVTDTTFLVDIPTIGDDRGSIGVIEEINFLPFKIRRVYYLHSIPHGNDRGGHAHYNLMQLIVAAHGSFTVETESKSDKKSYYLCNPKKGLFIGSMVWRELKSFSESAVCLVMASELYSESDYIRSYQSFQKIIEG